MVHVATPSSLVVTLCFIVELCRRAPEIDIRKLAN